MREIIFRGKRPNNGEWVEGDLYHNFIYNGESEKETRMGNIYFYGCKIHDTAFYMVDPETVGQFTGLTDKNGARIFEGDIVRTTARELYEIGYIEKYARFAGKRKGVVFAIINFKQCEVIGNVHDNPELLNDEREGQKAPVFAQN